MKWLRVVLAIAALFITSSCVSLKMEEARAGVEASVAQLPVLSEFDTVKVVYQTFCYSAYGLTCYYGRAYIIMGSSLPEDEALDMYAGALMLSGWMPSGIQYDTARELERGEHELVVIRSGQPSVDIAGAVDYLQLRSAYESVIFVELDFMLPNRESC